MTVPPRSYRPPLPSPPAMGISELLCGSPFPANADFSYFDPVHSEPASLSRASTNRRIPTYSPFRSYYGNLSNNHRKTGSIEQHLTPKSTSPPHSSDLDQDSPRPSSDFGPSTSRSSPGTRSPRIQNDGFVLAPHGSFTSARTASFSSSSSRSPGTSSGSRGSHDAYQHQPVAQVLPMDVEVRNALERSAAQGDQLATYRLGRAETGVLPRYTIGSVETVWGPLAT